MKQKACFCIGLVFFFLCSLLWAQNGSYMVIVNSSNPILSMSKMDVTRLFLKKVTAWTNGDKVLPVDREETSTLRMGFSTGILGRSIEKVKAYWAQQLFSGLGTPPVTLRSDQEVLEFVDGNPNAIGYVSNGADLRHLNVKVLLIK